MYSEGDNFPHVIGIALFSKYFNHREMFNGIFYVRQHVCLFVYMYFQLKPHPSTIASTKWQNIFAYENYDKTIHDVPLLISSIYFLVFCFRRQLWRRLTLPLEAHHMLIFSIMARCRKEILKVDLT